MAQITRNAPSAGITRIRFFGSMPPERLRRSVRILSAWFPKLPAGFLCPVPAVIPPSPRRVPDRFSPSY